MLDRTPKASGDFIRFLGIDPLEIQVEPPAKAFEPSDITLRSYSAGTIIADEESARQAIMFIVSGWISLGKSLPDGSNTIVDFALHGDMIAIGVTEWSRETVTALSDAVLFELSGTTHQCLCRYPLPICEKILQGMARRYARAAEHLVGLGRRGAFVRMAHLLVELAERAGPPAEGRSVAFPCPLTQAELGDALGLTAIHVNRVLKELRQRGLASFRNGVIELHDRRALQELAGFNPSYLSLMAS